DITVNNLPTGDIDGSTIICENDCVDIPLNNLTGTGPFEIDFEVNAQDDGESFGGVQTLGGLNAGDVFNICPSEDVVVSLLAIRDSNTPQCAITSTSTYDVAVNSFSQAIFEPDTLICENDAADLRNRFTNCTGPVSIDIDGVTSGPWDLTVDLTDSTLIVPVAPLVTTTYTISNFVDAGNPCTEILNDQVTVDLTGVPNAQFVQNEVICAGGNIDLELDINGGTGPYDVTVQSDDGMTVSEQDLLGINDGELLNVSPATSTTYTILSVTATGTPAACETNPNVIADVTVNTAPEATVVDTLCANTAESYQIVFTIENGDPNTYQVTEPGNLVDVGGVWTYTSDPVDPDVQNIWNLDDANNCAPSQIVIDPFTCPILTFSGTLDLTPIEICNTEALNVTFNNDEILDGNDVLNFVIHSSSDENLGIVYYVSDQPNWDPDVDLDFVGTLDYGTTYYISAVAGDDDGAGNVDFNSGGISVAQGTPVTFYEVPSVDVSGGGDICAGDEAQITFDFGGTGPWSIQYQIDGAPGVGFPLNSGDDPAILETGIAGEYTVLSVTNFVCNGTVTGAATIVVNDLPTGTLSQDGSFCEGGSYDLDIDLTGQANWDVTITHNDGDGGITDEVVNVAASPAVYTVTDSLTYFITSITDGNGCTNDVDSDPVTVTIDPLPTASFAFGDSTFCEGASVDVIINLTGTGPWTLDYTNVDGIQSEVIAATPHIINVSQNDQISLDQVQDNLGCVNVLNEFINLTVQPLPFVDAGPDMTVCDEEEFFIGTAPNFALTYQWTPNLWLFDETEAVGTGIANSGLDVDFTQEYIITARDFNSLKTYEAFGFIYDGISTSFKKIFFKPYYYENKNVR
ncbi:MAG: hypothetical protein HRT74_11375, partial [Flavobacteriales bacterium]|nr:hypothetical protein [Flavobacteriales bacterium]